jgi:hypothetical protein
VPAHGDEDEVVGSDAGGERIQRGQDVGARRFQRGAVALRRDALGGETPGDEDVAQQRDVAWGALQVRNARVIVAADTDQQRVARPSGLRFHGHDQQAHKADHRHRDDPHNRRCHPSRTPFLFGYD